MSNDVLLEVGLYNAEEVRKFINRLKEKGVDIKQYKEVFCG